MLPRSTFENTGSIPRQLVLFGFLIFFSVIICRCERNTSASGMISTDMTLRVSPKVDLENDCLMLKVYDVVSRVSRINRHTPHKVPIKKLTLSFYPRTRSDVYEQFPARALNQQPYDHQLGALIN